jgi:biotin-(acetyl-CoA carboxylase) ligase
MTGSAQSPVEGRAVGIDAHGHLVVATDAGDQQVVSAGDVTLLSRT